MKTQLRAVVLAVLLVVSSRTAEAIPVLQLDMAGGLYNTATESIVAPGGLFSLYAILTPKANLSSSQLQALLNETYYVSVAVTPQVNSPAPLGSFTFGQTGTTPQNINVTSGMTYGTPPIELLASAQGHDGADLPQHGVYPTYFAEFAFQFSTASRTVQYNSQDDPGGLTPSSSGGAYFVEFLGDSRLLQSGFNLHFDLYDTVARNCSRNGTCSDIDVDRFAPFSHDAHTYNPPPPPPPPPPQVPEPATALLLLAGLASAVAGRKYAK